MTTVQLFQRIGRRARGNDFTKLGLTEQGDIAEAANSALMQVYNALPPYLREITEGFVLPAPKAITVTATKYSNVVSSDAFDPTWIGRTVILDGDPTWNIIIDTSRVLSPFLGVSGVVSGTVYGDAIYSERYPFDRVIGNPTFSNQTLTPLVNFSLSRSNSAPLNWIFGQSVGMPQGWWPMMMGNSQGSEPLLVLRFAPAPDQDYGINIRMSYWPKRLTMADYDNNTTLTVPDQYWEAAVLPIARRELMSSPIWDTRPDDDKIIERAAEAIQYLKMQVSQVVAPNNRIYTPIGF